MFDKILLHSLTELPKIPSGTLITQYLPKSTTKGSLSHSLLFNSLADGHIKHPGNMKLSFLGIPAFCLLYVTKGSLIVSLYKTQLQVTQSSLLLFDCASPYSIIPEQTTEYDIVYFQGSLCGYYEDIIEKNTGIYGYSLFKSNQMSGLSTALRPLLPSGERNLHDSEILFNRHMTDLLSDIVLYTSVSTDTENTMPKYLPAIKEYMDNNFYKKITLEDLEKMFFVSRFSICKAFTTYYYVSPMQYLHLIRINKAQVLLKETSLKVHEVSYQVGYESVGRFINHYKKVTGHTPSKGR